MEKGERGKKKEAGEKPAASDRRRIASRWLDWLRTHPWISACITVLLIFVALNALAFVHAYAMTHFVEGGGRTGTPEALSFWQKAGVLAAGVRVPRPTHSVTPADRGMAFEVRQIHGPSGIDLEAWYIPVENSRGLCVLFHGYAECKSSLLPEAQTLRESGYETLLVDSRGCGGSGGNATTIGFREADDVAAAVDYARQTLLVEKPILYGRSMGWAAILRAIAVADVEPRAVILECPFDRLLSTAKNRFSAMGLPSFPCEHLLIFWGGVQPESCTGVTESFS